MIFMGNDYCIEEPITQETRRLQPLALLVRRDKGWKPLVPQTASNRALYTIAIFDQRKSFSTMNNHFFGNETFLRSMS
jgi:hypothetical protein